LKFSAINLYLSIGRTNNFEGQFNQQLHRLELATDVIVQKFDA
jgi:hypothetical protein